MPEPFDLSEFMPDPHGPLCTTGLALAKLTNSQRQLLEAAIAEPITVKKKILARLNEWSGMTVRDGNFRRHCAKGCACE